MSPSRVLVYDSVYNSVERSTKMQIASIMHTSEKRIHLNIPNKQYQKGSSDCGLFAIAYATDIAHGNDPIGYRYKQDLHFLDYLKCS